MHIAHIAIWSEDPGRLRDFYQQYFGAKAGEKYHNPLKQFRSYFLFFSEGCSIEVMYKPGLKTHPEGGSSYGYTHLALSAGSCSEVDRLTETLRADGFRIVGEPRTTGDGFYESVVVDPDGNLIEITE